MHTLEQLIAFVAVYEQGSYSSAARQLNKSRTTVREHIVSYEDLLGYSLFTIEGRKAVATDKAIQLYHRAKIVEKQNRLLYSQSKSLYQQHVHTINICYDVMTPSRLILGLEQLILQYNPHITVNWLHRSRKQAMELLVNNQCDFAIMPNQGQLYAEKSLTWMGVGAINIGFYAGVNSPLAKKQSLTLADLMLDIQYLTENLAALQPQFISTKVSPKVHLVSNNDLLCELLKYHGWAAMPKHYMQPWVERGELIELTLDEISNDISFGLNMFYCHGKEGVEVFSQILKWVPLCYREFKLNSY